ncbi:MAG: hypothetical protein CMO98_07200 [Woeseia sp.]|nr:hypothetical protein [Woeseia sp.]|tara:strand:- start:2317 stop:4080 length:1764 start_codon:yes stop_codon:yes gene_type:complete
MSKVNNKHNIADPVTTEVVRGWMESVTEEMQATVVKTAHSLLICEARDATCALFDRDGRTAAQASAMPIHLGTLAELGRRFAAKYPAGVAQPGDLYIANDPYAGGTHMPDIAICAPVFSNDELVGYVSSMAHHRDIGGLLPASVSVNARDLHAEGLRIPIIRIARAGQIDHGVMQVILACSRTPRSFRGDLDAQIAACNTGATRFAELFERWPVETIYAAFTNLTDYAERMTRAEIEKIPDGEYYFEDKLDDNALSADSEPIVIAVTMTVRGDELIFDFTGTDKQVESSINNVLTSTAAVVYFGVRTLTGDHVPNNDGCYRPITVTAPAGTIVNCSYPAPVASRGLSLMRIEDVVIGVMGKALPERMTAANCGQYTMVSVAGPHPDTGEHMIGQLGGPVVGGHGARATKDGIDVSSHGCTNGSILSMEISEARYPMKFNKLELWTDSGGVGRWRGGLGYFSEVEWLRGNSSITFRRERMRFQPWGMQGGGPAPLCKTEYVRQDGVVEELPGKIEFPLKSGEQLRYWTTGSGGYGSALQRDPDHVLNDVLDGRVSNEAAYDNYGVVLDGNEINRVATTELRTKMETSV